MEPETKKLKLEGPVSKKQEDQLFFHEFTTEKTIQVNPQSKLIAIVGKFPSNPESRGVIVAEKQPLTNSSLSSIFSSDTKVSKVFQNDIYSQYILNCGNGIGELKVTSVYPATDTHVKKYSDQALVMFHETPSDYQTITKPFIQNHLLSIEVSLLLHTHYMYIHHQSRGCHTTVSYTPLFSGCTTFWKGGQRLKG